MWVKFQAIAARKSICDFRCQLERGRERGGTCGGNANLGEMKSWSEHLQATVPSTSHWHSPNSCKISEASCNGRVGSPSNCSLYYRIKVRWKEGQDTTSDGKRHGARVNAEVYFSLIRGITSLLCNLGEDVRVLQHEVSLEIQQRHQKVPNHAQN